MWRSPQFPADLVTFTEEILNRKHHFLFSVPLWIETETRYDTSKDVIKMIFFPSRHDINHCSNKRKIFPQKNILKDCILCSLFFLEIIILF